MGFTPSQWDDFLQPGGGLESVVDGIEDAEALLGERLGVFELTEVIGSGGMASVYRARRIDGEFDQEVAVKVVHAGIGDTGLEQRFRQERQILARLDHPGIARVIDGGVHEDGRPYLVMDLVEGAPIDAWCRDQQASLEQRLELLLQVADAVQFAHRHLVVHCDLKPSNILVDARGQPRLLDFGIAQAFSGGPETLDDEPGFRPFTPLYAAPEQLRGEGVQVATDIWQLGLLFCELLTGAHPWRRYREDLSALTHQILEGTPPKPSDLALGSEPPVEARWREIDAIVGRCLDKDPAQRYPHAAAWADDIRALSLSRPVDAVGGGTGYRVGRFAARHQPALLAGLVVVVALGAMAWWGQSRVDEERDRADAMAEFVGQLVASTDPLAGDFEARELISVSGFEPPAAVRRDPVLEREFVLLSGRTLVNLERFDRVITLVAPLVAQLEDLEEPDRRLAEYLSLLGYARFRQGDLTAGHADLSRAVELMVAAEDTDPASRLLAARRLAQLEQSAGRTEAATAVLSRVLELDGELPEAASTWLDLGLAAGSSGNLDTAITALSRAETLAAVGALRVAALAALADAQRLAGRLTEAESTAAQAVGLAGNDAAMRATALVARASVLRALNRYPGAADDYRAALGALRATQGADHPRVGRIAGELAVTLSLDGRCAAAGPVFEEALKIGGQAGWSAEEVGRLERQRDVCQ